MRKKGKFALLLALLLIACCACGKAPEEEPPTPVEEDPEPYTLTVRVGAEQPTLDPAAVTAQGGETVLFHLFENLMRWADGGDGWAVLAQGQAEGYAVETDYAGNATYTFTLREDAFWSDGKAVSAGDFVYAWRRLADPAGGSPHRELMAAVAGFDAVQETGDVSLLAVSAPDEKTFAVTLNGSPAYFLAELCAGAYTMPQREDLSDGDRAEAAVTNGAYSVSSRGGKELLLVKNESYYAPSAQGPEFIAFSPVEGSEADFAALSAGEAGLVVDLPQEELAALAESGLWTPEPVCETYGVLLNTQRPPFDDANVRLAFRLAVDRQAVAEALGDAAVRPAPGLIPYGVAGYAERPVQEHVEPEESVLPDPNAAPAPAEPDPTYQDFRAHAAEVLTLDSQPDYEADCRYAQALMAQAGYAGGGGFPVVEYLYMESAQGRAVALALQGMWKEQLGVTVTVRGVGQEEYDAALAPVQPDGAQAGGEGEIPIPRTGPFTMAAQGFSPAYSDAMPMLECWHSQSGANVTGYASSAFDILVDAARAAVSPDARDAYFHDAEAILLEDAPVIPVICQGGSFRLAEGYTGLYRAPDGVFFLADVVRGG